MCDYGVSSGLTLHIFVGRAVGTNDKSVNLRWLERTLINHLVTYMLGEHMNLETTDTVDLRVNQATADVTQAAASAPEILSIANPRRIRWNTTK